MAVNIKEICTDMGNSRLFLTEGEEAIAQMVWNAHPKFPGVFLKHLIKGAVSDGKLSCHLVSVNPGCALETHIHENQWELHQVLAGDGHCLLNDRRIPYNPGCLALIPPGAQHRVEAGDKGLMLLATFSPALL